MTSNETFDKTSVFSHVKLNYHKYDNKSNNNEVL